jgi:hypothetical protein
LRFGPEWRKFDHSTFSKNWHGRFRDSDLLRRLFETVLQRCIDEGWSAAKASPSTPADPAPTPATAIASKAPRSAAGSGRTRGREYLAVLDDAARRGERGHAEVHCACRPGRAWTAAHRGPAFFGYSTNYLIDVDNAIIIDVEATTAIRQAEIRCKAHDRALEHFDCIPNA